MWDMAFHLLWPIAWSAAERRLGNFDRHSVEDIAIAAIAEAAEKVKLGEVATFDELKTLTGLIAQRRALDHIRRMQAARRAAGATETLEGRDDPVSMSPGPLEKVEATDLAKLLWELLAGRLSERPRELLQAFYVDGLTQEEIAERFGMPIATVGVTLMRSRKALATFLKKHPKLMKELREASRFI